MKKSVITWCAIATVLIAISLIVRSQFRGLYETRALVGLVTNENTRSDLLEIKRSVFMNPSVQNRVKNRRSGSYWPSVSINSVDVVKYPAIANFFEKHPFRITVKGPPDGLYLYIGAPRYGIAIFQHKSVTFSIDLENIVYRDNEFCVVNAYDGF